MKAKLIAQGNDFRLTLEPEDEFEGNDLKIFSDLIGTNYGKTIFSNGFKYMKPEIDFRIIMPGRDD